VILGVGTAAASADTRFSAQASSRIAVSHTKPAVAARFRKTTLASPLRDPMQLAVAPDGRVFYVERAGRVQVYEPDSGTTRQLASLDVPTTGEHGLLGLALDPRFLANGWIYLTYSRVVGSGVDLRVSRFTLNGGGLDLQSESVLLSIPTQGDCCHEAGSLAFGPDGNLYLSTGDDTNPYDSEGYAPIDERSGRAVWDAQKSASNTMDLRGKILRIRPRADGGYTVPSGNLFPAGGGGRPEIYAMGLRNPFRFSLDPKTGWLYVGDAGPDADTSSATRGPRGYDEIDRAREAGNYGWPYCIADNEPYLDYQFDTGLSGPAFDCAAPTNDSPNNAGSLALPSARAALIWYPYADSPEFPQLGTGSRTALAGPVYRRPRTASRRAFPSHYKGNLFIYDWSRSWVKTVHFDHRGDPVRIEPFGSGLTFRRPIDMEFGPDGALYVLEWGTGFSGSNDDSGLYRIDYG
jgi:glucose/arabinose dehydrogenase